MYCIMRVEKRKRKDSVVLLDGFYGASPEWFLNRPYSEIVDYFKDCLTFHEKHYGTVINAVIHFDENTPHLQVASIPLIKGEDGRCRLSAREVMGNRDDYRERQDLFFEQVGKPRGLQRGESRDPEQKREHLSVQEFKQRQLEAEVAQLQELDRRLKRELKPKAEQYNQLQQAVEALEDQWDMAYVHYAMERFIKSGVHLNAKGERVALVDIFQRYMAEKEEELRQGWRELYPQVSPPDMEERAHELEYEQAPEYDDREL